MTFSIGGKEIHKEAGSVRLVFVQDATAPGLWHIADVAISKAFGGAATKAVVYYMALHGNWVYPSVRADTLLQVQLMNPGVKVRICERCQEEFNLARDVIESRKLMRFE